MQTSLSILVDALAYGMVLFVISIGLSVTMGLMRVINLAHGAFAMIGGTIASYGTVSLGLPFWLALAAGIAGAVAIAVPLEIGLFRRIYGSRDPLPQVLMTIGITFVIIGVTNWALGPTLKTITLPAILSGPVDLGFRTLPAHRFLVVATGVAVALGLWLLIERTDFGIRLRAAVDDPRMAAALGIRTKLIYAATFALSIGLAALGGVIGAEILPIEPYYALRYMVTFLVVVSVGGAGSIGGALIAALLLGLVDTVGKYTMPEFGDFFFYAAVIAVVWTFPQGLLGRAH